MASGTNAPPTNSDAGTTRPRMSRRPANVLARIVTANARKMALFQFARRPTISLVRKLLFTVESATKSPHGNAKQVISASSRTDGVRTGFGVHVGAVGGASDA